VHVLVFSIISEELFKYLIFLRIFIQSKHVFPDSFILFFELIWIKEFAYSIRCYQTKQRNTGLMLETLNSFYFLFSTHIADFLQICIKRINHTNIFDIILNHLPLRVKVFCRWRSIDPDILFNLPINNRSLSLNIRKRNCFCFICFLCILSHTCRSSVLSQIIGCVCCGICWLLLQVADMRFFLKGWNYFHNEFLSL
jgi:hypothetical protein